MSKFIEGLESIKVLFDTKAKQSENAGYWKDFAGIIADAISTITESRPRIENMEKVIEDLEERVAIASPDVIRCKDCGYKEKDGISEGFHYCNINGLQVTDDWFCADGKPKEGEAE